MKKLSFLTSMVALTFAVPAMAVPSNTSSTFPSNGVMEEDYTYQNQATVTNLKVSSGTATTTANYANCPSGYPNSDEGATSTDECYTACTVSYFPANSHIASVTGKVYQGYGVTNTCAIASCDTGYHLNPGNPNLTSIIGESGGTDYGYKGFDDNDYHDDYNDTDYGLTQNGEFAVNYGDKGEVHGFARCSSEAGDNHDMTWAGSGVTIETLPDSAGQYCYCQLDEYIPNAGSAQSISAPWVFYSDYGSASPCANSCAEICVSALRGDYGSALPFRAAVSIRFRRAPHHVKRMKSALPGRTRRRKISRQTTQVLSHTVAISAHQRKQSINQVKSLPVGHLIHHLGTNPTTTKNTAHTGGCFYSWRTQQDLNLQSLPSEGNALSSCAMGACASIIYENSKKANIY